MRSKRSFVITVMISIVAIALNLNVYAHRKPAKESGSDTSNTKPVINLEEYLRDELEKANAYDVKVNTVAENSATAKYGIPIVDGIIEEMWNKTEDFIPKSYIAGTSGATCTVRVLWGDKFLYVYADINDKTLNANNTKEPWNEDSFEIFIDENNDKDQRYTQGCAQYRVNYKNEQSFGTGAKQDAFTTATAVKNDGSGYIVEAAIPFQILNPEISRTIGFDIQLNDNIKGDVFADTRVCWNDKTGSNWGEPINFGDMTLR